MRITYHLHHIRLAVSLLAVSVLGGCFVQESTIPMSPFESQGSRPAQDLPQSGPPTDAVATNQSSPEPTKRENAPKASVFMVRWSLPASALNIREFRIDYGVDPTALENSLKLIRKDLEAEYSSNNTEILFHHPLSVPGDSPTLSVKISAISDTGQSSSSAVFTSSRIGDSPTR